MTHSPPPFAGTPDTPAGPLAGLRVVELAGLGPAPHAAVLLADMGAEVVRVQRTGELASSGEVPDQQLRNRRLVEADLKSPDDRDAVLRLLDHADVVLEGFRPGVTERLGLGPDIALQRNPRLVYGRMTGWGQDGPLAARAGHDINYVAMSGVLNTIGRRDEPPTVPLNLLGDFGGGSMFLIFGVLAALYEREHSGLGQVVDAAIIDGVAALSHMLWGWRGQGLWNDDRGDNKLDGSLPFYSVYETADGRYVAVGALEEKFYAQLLDGLGIADVDLPEQWDRSGWLMLRKTFEAAFRRRTRDEWEQVFRDTDACVTAVLNFDEATRHPQYLARGSLNQVGGVMQHAPTPRFSRTAPARPTPVASTASPIAEIEQIWCADPRNVGRT